RSCEPVPVPVPVPERDASSRRCAMRRGTYPLPNARRSTRPARGKAFSETPGTGTGTGTGRGHYPARRDARLVLEPSTMAVGTVTDHTFEREILQSDLPVLVEFSAEWCGPCKTVAPELLALSEELRDKAKVVTIDVDRSPLIARELGVQSV